MNFSPPVLGETALGGKHQNLTALALEMIDGVFETGDNAINLGQKGLGKESNSHGKPGAKGNEILKRASALGER
jgi:hypothetical protein